MTQGKEIAVAAPQQNLSPFSTAEGFELIQRVSNAFATSGLVPDHFKKNVGNCLIAVELANRIGASPLMVMQNLHIIHGRPAFSSKFIISAVNACGSFSPLRFRIEKRGRKKLNGVEFDDVACTAFAIEKATGEVLEGPTVSMEMAVQEGWYGKTGSKWKTMPDLMLRYRAASFFGNLYAPQILMGMQTEDEVYDIDPPARDVSPAPAASVDALNDGIAEAKRRGRKPQTIKPTVIDVQANAEPAVETELPAAEEATGEALHDAAAAEDGGNGASVSADDGNIF